MFKYKTMVFILLVMILISGQAYCQSMTQDQNVETITGTVTYVDPEGGIIKVGDTVFYIFVESYLFRGTHPMASIEIEKGDPVAIQYNTTAGKNYIIRLVDNKPDSV